MKKKSKKEISKEWERQMKYANWILENMLEISLKDYKRITPRKCPL